MSNNSDITLAIVGRYSNSKLIADLTGTPSAYKELGNLLLNKEKETARVGLVIPTLKSSTPYAGFLWSIFIKVDKAQPDLNISREGNELIIVGSQESQDKLAEDFLTLSEAEIRLNAPRTHFHIEYFPGVYGSYLSPTALALVASLIPEGAIEEG